MKKRELRPDLKLYEGYTKHVSGGGHIKIKNASGKTVATLASTPGEGRAVANEQALVARLGIGERKRRRPVARGTALSQKEWGWFKQALDHHGSAKIYADAIMDKARDREMRMPKSVASLAVTISRIHKHPESHVSPWMRELLLLGDDYLPKLDVRKRRRRGRPSDIRDAGIRGAESALKRVEATEFEIVRELQRRVGELDARVQQLEDLLTRPG